MIYWDEPEVNDNSGEVIIASISQGPASGTRFSVGPSAVITYTAEDSSGNEGFCVFSITVFGMCIVHVQSYHSNYAMHSVVHNILI